MDQEIWKDVKGYESLYVVSNMGRVIVLPRERPNYTAKKKVLKLRSDSANKYILVDFNSNGKKETRLAHRIVAEAFILNPECKEQVNHMNGNKQDNRAVNLEWVSRSENAKHFYRTLSNPGSCKGRFGAKHSKSKKILQLDMTTDEVVRIFFGALEVKRELGFDSSSIHKCCKGLLKSVRGFKWKYHE